MEIRNQENCINTIRVLPGEKAGEVKSMETAYSSLPYNKRNGTGNDKDGISNKSHEYNFRSVER